MQPWPTEGSDQVIAICWSPPRTLGTPGAPASEHDGDEALEVEELVADAVAVGVRDIALGVCVAVAVAVSDSLAAVRVRLAVEVADSVGPVAPC